MKLPSSWIKFAKEVPKLNEKDLAEEIHKELKGLRRYSFVKKMHSRYTRLRSKRELWNMMRKGEW